MLFASSILRKPSLTQVEVLVVLYNFCTLSKKRLPDYTFQVLDDFGGGSIDREVGIGASILWPDREGGDDG